MFIKLWKEVWIDNLTILLQYHNIDKESDFSYKFHGLLLKYYGC